MTTVLNFTPDRRESDRLNHKIELAERCSWVWAALAGLHHSPQILGNSLLHSLRTAAKMDKSFVKKKKTTHPTRLMTQWVHRSWQLTVSELNQSQIYL